jgi:hypothetical protein
VVDIEVGEVKWYHEMGIVFEVKVLEKDIDGDQLKFLLEVTGNHKDSNAGMAPDPGTTFHVTQSIAHSCNGGWSLQED